MTTDTEHMTRALELAASARGLVGPRPPVGAVVLDASGRIVGEGATEPHPSRHAEVVALDQAGDRARGGTIIVTLEPCSHTGATGPCAEAIIDAGVRRVVAGVVDPNPAVSGEGFRMLREAGLDVTAGFMAEESVALIEPFKTWVTLGRPFVTLKMAASLDGKVAAPDGTSRWITGEPARLQVHEIRSTVDAILVGSGTVLADDPQLTVRLPDFHANQPRRVVFDSSGRTPATARVFDGTAPAVVVTTSGAPGPARSAWEEAGAEVIEVPSGEGGVDVRAALRELAALGISHVLAEGGPALAAGLMAEGLVDHLILYLAPIVIGGDAPGLFAGGAKTLTEAWNLEIVEVSRIGDDLRIDARRSD